MDPIITALVAAIAAGAAKGTGEAATKFIVDSYGSLKALLQRKFGDDSPVSKAVQGLEEKPQSDGRRQMLKEELDAASAMRDPELVKLAQALLAAMEQHPDSAQHIQQAIGSYIAIADRSSTAQVHVNKIRPDEP